jgi:hypothetical protein
MCVSVCGCVFVCVCVGGGGTEASSEGGQQLKAEAVWARDIERAEPFGDEVSGANCLADATMGTTRRSDLLGAVVARCPTQIRKGSQRSGMNTVSDVDAQREGQLTAMLEGCSGRSVAPFLVFQHVFSRIEETRVVCGIIHRDT